MATDESHSAIIDIMNDWLEQARLYLLAVGLIPLVGMLIVYWGVYGDRSKGRRARCPKCWHDMGATLPSLTCPNCRHDAGQEQLLYRRRRRWSAVGFGALVILAACYMGVIVGGWAREQIIQEELTVKLVPALTPLEGRRIGPPWLVTRLPEGFAQFFERQRTASPRTAADVAVCRKLRYLNTLHLRYDQITDEALTGLKLMPQLERISITYTPVTDAGMVHLEDLPRLRQLTVGFTPLTDASLVYFEAMVSLKELKLIDTQVTEAALKKLQLARPHLRITAVKGGPDRSSPFGDGRGGGRRGGRTSGGGRGWNRDGAEGSGRRR